MLSVNWMDQHESKRDSITEMYSESDDEEED